MSEDTIRHGPGSLPRTADNHEVRPGMTLMRPSYHDRGTAIKESIVFSVHFDGTITLSEWTCIDNASCLAPGDIEDAALWFTMLGPEDAAPWLPANNKLGILCPSGTMLLLEKT